MSSRAPGPREPGEEPTLPAEALLHAGSLYNVARRLTGARGDAEDLVQDAYARAVAAAGSFTPGTNLRAWLFRILRNAHIDQARRRQRDPTREGRSVGDSDDEGPLALALISRPEPLRGDLELERLRGLVSGEIEEALAALGEEQRAVILLDLEGLSEVEVAAVLGCAVGTVKSRLSRARAALRLALAHYAPDAGPAGALPMTPGASTRPRR